MKVLFGELNNPTTKKSYTGINTETANTTIDNTNNTIKVDVNTNTIATIDYVNEHIDTFTGEITLSGDEELVLQIQNGRLYHEGELYTGDITFSDVTPIITLNVNNGITYFEDELYTDTITLSGDATLYIVYEKGLVKNITSANPNLDGTVHYDSEQELTEGQKEVARDNIDAISSGEVSNLILESERSFGVYPLVFEEVEFESKHYLGLSKSSYDRAVSARMYFYYIKGGSYYEDDGETGGYIESFIVPNVYPAIDGSSLSFTVVSDDGAVPDVAFVQLGSGDDSVYILRPLP